MPVSASPDPAGPAPPDVVRTALDLVPTGVAVLDGDLRVVLANPALAAVRGVRAGPLDGALLAEVLVDSGPVEALCREVLAGGRPVSGRLVRGAPGRGPGASACLRIDVRPAGRTGSREALVLSVEDVTEHRRALDAVASLQALTAELSGASSLEAVLRVALDHAGAAVGAAAVSVGVVEEAGDELRVITVGFPAEVSDPFTRLPLDAPLPGPATVRDGRARYFADRAGAVAQFPSADSVVAGTPFEAAAVQPLVRAGRRLGYLAVHFTAAGDIDDGDRELLDAVARSCAGAVYRARRSDEDRAERDLARRMQALAGALAVASTAADVAVILTEQCPAVLGATVAIVGIYDPDTRSFGLATPTSAVPGDVRARFARWPLDAPLPSRDVAATGQPVIFRSLADRDEQYPALAGVPVAEQAWVQMPLQQHGQLLGTVSFGWPEERDFTADEIARVGAIAELCAGALERARLADEQRQIAEALQRSLLPRRLPDVPGWEFAARYQPAGAAARAGGDWYDAFVLTGGRVGLLIGDVAGHGVPAAGLMGQVRALARAHARGGDPPAAVLTALNADVHDLGTDDGGMFVTCCYLQIDPARGRLAVGSAGHLPPLVRLPAAPGAERADVTPVAFDVGVPLGVRRDARYSSTVSPLPAGATVLLFTDGLVERHDGLLDDELAELAARVAVAPVPMEALCDALMAAALADAEPTDDIALLAVRSAPGGATGRSRDS